MHLVVCLELCFEEEAIKVILEFFRGLLRAASEF